MNLFAAFHLGNDVGSMTADDSWEFGGNCHVGQNQRNTFISFSSTLDEGCLFSGAEELFLGFPKVSSSSFMDT